MHVAAHHLHPSLSTSTATYYKSTARRSVEKPAGQQQSPLCIAQSTACLFNVTHSMWLAADAELWTTGSNDSCQLGHKGHDNQLSPSRVEALDAHGVCQVACGHQHMLAVADAGALCAWGAADSGQLGQTLNIRTFNPVVLICMPL